MKTIVADEHQVAFCGIYCGSCRRFLKGGCPGCHENEKAGWCKIRTCCMENGYTTCADCKDHADPNDCKYFNNFMSKMFGLVFRSDRKAGIEYIRQHGCEQFAQHMAENKLISMKK